MTMSEFNEKIRALSMRERGIVVVAILLLVYGLWYFLWFYSAENKRDQVVTELASLQSQAQGLQTEIQTFQALAGNSAYQNKRDEIARAEARLAQLDTELAQLSHGLVEPGQLAKVIGDVLRQTREVNLIELTTEPAILIPISTGNDAEPTEPTAHTSGVYRHTVQVTFTGSYFEVYEVVSRLESLPWRFYWELLDYQVLGYPEAKVKLRLFTLSAEEGRLGV